MTKTRRSTAELLWLGAQTQQLIDEIRDLDLQVHHRIAERHLTEALEHGDADELLRVLDDQERAQQAAATVADQQAQQQRREDNALQLVQCPVCEQPPGEPCVTKTGTKIAHPHRRRLTAG